MKSKIYLIIGLILMLVVAIISIFIFTNKDDEITITFENDGEVTKRLTVKKNDRITLPIVTKEGYTFEGWYYENNKVSDDDSFVSDVTLKAKWIASNKPLMIITFDTDGGSKLPRITIECDSKLELPKPTKDGYKFLNWYDKNENVITDETKLICENITLRAKWEKVEEKKEEVKPIEEPKTIEVKKEYTCPDDYTLNDTKCEMMVDVSEKCPDGSSEDGNLCVVTTGYNNDSNYKGIRNCNLIMAEINKLGGIEMAFGEYYGDGLCGYYEWEQFLTKEACDEANTQDDYVTVWDNNKCYAKVIANNYELICISGYKKYTSDELSTKFGIQGVSGCLKTVPKEQYCMEDFELVDNKCVKTINAILK